MKKNIHETFEEFWQNSGLAAFADTPEKVDHYRKQFERELKYREECNYFEPEEIVFDTTFVGEYNKRLFDIFEIDKIEEGQIFVLVKASFEPEYLLKFSIIDEQYVCSHHQLSAQFWAAQYAETMPAKISMNRAQCALEFTQGKQLFRVLHQMIEDARPSANKMIVLDGVRYSVFVRKFGGIKKFIKHSPPETSATGLCIAVFDQIIALIHEPESGSADFVAALDALTDKIDG
jgi:hypothetical protein